MLKEKTVLTFFVVIILAFSITTFAHGKDDMTGTWRVVSGDTNCQKIEIRDETWSEQEGVYLLDGGLDFVGGLDPASSFEGGSSRTKLGEDGGRILIYWKEWARDHSVFYKLKGTFNAAQTVIQGTVYKNGAATDTWKLKRPQTSIPEEDKKAKPKKLQAYRNINFTDSKKLVRSKIKSSPEIKLYKVYQKQGIFLTITTVGLTGEVGQSGHSNIAIFYFFKDQLYGVVFQTVTYYSLDRFSEIKQLRDELVNQVTSQYGSASKSRELKISALKKELEDGEWRWSHKWKKADIDGKKRILVGIIEDPNEGNKKEYGAILNMQYVPLFKQAEKES